MSRDYLVPQRHVQKFIEQETLTDQVIETALSAEAAERIMIGALEMAVSNRKNNLKFTDCIRTGILHRDKKDYIEEYEIGEGANIREGVSVEVVEPINNSESLYDAVNYSVAELEPHEALPRISVELINGKIQVANPQPQVSPRSRIRDEDVDGHTLDTIKDLPSNKKLFRTRLGVEKGDDKTTYMIGNGRVDIKVEHDVSGRMEQAQPDSRKTRKTTKHTHAAAQRLAKIHIKKLDDNSQVALGDESMQGTEA